MPIGVALGILALVKGQQGLGALGVFLALLFGLMGMFVFPPLFGEYQLNQQLDDELERQRETDRKIRAGEIFRCNPIVEKCPFQGEKRGENPGNYFRTIVNSTGTYPLKCTNYECELIP